MKQVLIRQKLANGDNQMIRVDVLAEEGDKLRIKHPHRLKPEEVLTKDTMPVEAVFGSRLMEKNVIPKCYPVLPNCLANRNSF